MLIATFLIIFRKFCGLKLVYIYYIIYCELASHFISLSSTAHKLDKTSQATFTSELIEHIAIILIESVNPSPSLDVESFLKEGENFWQGALKSTPLYGGINKRTNKHKKKS